MTQLPATGRPGRLRVIREVVTEVLELEPAELTDSSHFVNDHGADSLRAIEILARLEKSFGVEIPQDGLARMSTVGNTYELLKESAGWSD